MMITRKILPLVSSGVLALLSTALGSCSMEKAVEMFADTGCVYYGILSVNRDARDDMQLVSYFLGGTPSEVSMYPKETWANDEQEKRVQMGEHLVLYYPQKSVTLDEKKLELSLPSGLLSEKPLPFDFKRVEVPYESEATADMVFSRQGTIFKINLTNSSTQNLIDVDITSSSAYLGYDILIGKPSKEGIFKHTKEPFNLESLGHRELLGYAFGVNKEKPIDITMTFRDQNGIEYIISDDLKGIYKQDEKVSNLYVAHIDLTDDYLINMGAKTKVTAVEIDGKDLIFPPAGGKMTMDVKAVVRTKTYQYGKVIDSVDGAEVPWSFEVKGDQNIKVIREGNSLIFTGPINDTPNARKVEVVVTATGKGVTRTFTITQKPYGFDISGEVE